MLGKVVQNGPSVFSGWYEDGTENRRANSEFLTNQGRFKVKNRLNLLVENKIKQGQILNNSAEFFSFFLFVTWQDSSI